MKNGAFWSKYNQGSAPVLFWINWNPTTEQHVSARTDSAGLFVKINLTYKRQKIIPEILYCGTANL